MGVHVRYCSREGDDEKFCVWRTTRIFRRETVKMRVLREGHVHSHDAQGKGSRGRKPPVFSLDQRPQVLPRLRDT